MIRMTMGLMSLALVGCASAATGDLTMTATRGLAEARGVHAIACEGIIKAHAIGTLVGEKFNQARQFCILADEALDSGDSLLKAGQVAEALAQRDKATSLLAMVPQ